MKRGVNDSAHIEQEESIQRTRKGFKFIVKTNNVNSQCESHYLIYDAYENLVFLLSSLALTIQH